MNYKLLTLCLSLMVAAVNVSAQPQKHPRSPDSTDATSAKRAAVTVATADDTTATSAGDATPRPISIDGVDGPVQVTLSNMSFTQAMRQANLIVSTHLNRTITFTNLLRHTVCNDLPDDCLSIIFDFVCQNNGPESKSSNQLRLVCTQWRDIYESYRRESHRPVTITLANMPEDQAIPRLQQCVLRRPNARVMSVSFDNLDPPPSLQALLPALSLSRALDIQLAIKGSPANPTLIEDEDILAISAALGDKITRLDFDSKNMMLTEAGLAGIAENMTSLRSLSLKFYDAELTEIGCKHISDMTNLTELSLSTGIEVFITFDEEDRSADDDIFDALSLQRMNALRRLEISEYPIGDWHIRYFLRHQPQLTDVDFHGARLRNSSDDLCLLSGLTRLNLSHTDISEADELNYLSQMTQLRHLDMRQDPYPTQEVLLLSGCTNLRTLKFSTDEESIFNTLCQSLPQTEITAVLCLKRKARGEPLGVLQTLFAPVPRDLQDHIQELK